MAEFPALPLWTDAYLGDTTHLTTIQHGAYLLLLFAAWRSKGCDLPDDDAVLAKIVHLTGQQWARNKAAVMFYWVLQNGRWSNNRLRDELDTVRRQRDQKKLAGRASALKRQHRGSTAVAEPSNGCSTPTPTPTPIEENRDHSDRPVGHRGTRWPADAVVDAVWLDHALIARRRNMLPDIDLALQAEMFTNYWSSSSGRNATKLDWHKTWINWALKAEAPRNGRGKTSSAHDKFFAGVDAAIRETLGEQPATPGGDNVVIGPFGGPLLPR